MVLFLVHKSFYLASRDLVIFTGKPVEGELTDGLVADFAIINGPQLPVASLEVVEFTDGSEVAFTVAMQQLAGFPTFEPNGAEGRVVTLRTAPPAAP